MYRFFLEEESINKKNCSHFEQIKYTVVMQIEKSKYIALFMNLLLPGLGHIFWKEYIFGIFVFLIVLIGIILFFVSFFIDLSTLIIILMLTLPVIFYFFTFLDLVKTVKQKFGKVKRTRKTALIFLASGFLFQVAAPITPLNFFIRNFPQYFVVEQNNLSPLYHQGDILKADRLAYLVDIFFLEKPLLIDLPKRYEIIRFVDLNNFKNVGIVLALPKEEFEMAQGVIVINGMPDITLPPGNLVFMGDIELTLINEYSILVATLNLGTIDKIYEIPFKDIIGKVEKAF